MGPFGPGTMTLSVQPPRENASSMVLFTTALSASAPSTAPIHCAKMYMTALEMEIRPTSAAAKVMAGLMWPPEIGLMARRTIVVLDNIVEPALQACAGNDWHKPVSQEAFLLEFKKVAELVAQHLKEQPVIVAHSENTFDGSGVKRLLSNKFELDKLIENVPRDRNGKISKEYLRLVLDVVAPAAGLPPIGAVDQMDKVVGEVFKMLSVDDGKQVKEDEFKKILTEILGSIMLQLEGNSISVSTNSVVHEPLASSSSLLLPSSQ
uniref:EF-hand domain-containing protein n=1 Tax=Fagus sylvatica TaxID=28930 RepID=A0A2N9GZP5_FAGSY